MIGFTLYNTVASLVFLSLPLRVFGIPTISAKGSKLYLDTTGEQFFAKGVIYTSSGRNDVLLDTNQCQLDAGLIKSMGANTIRVYGVDGSKNHDGCMKAFESQNIYVWLDLPTPDNLINRTTPMWTMKMYDNWTATIDSFAGYDNLLSFTVGSGVVNSKDTTLASPYIKAAARDIRAFRHARGYRPIPISYASNQISALTNLESYLTCGSDSNSTIEMFGINSYSWCGDSDYTQSNFDTVYENFQKSNIPILFSETGCNVVGRNFTEVAAMLGPVFQNKFSGAYVYEWPMESNDYGLVKYNNDVQTGFPQLLSDYSALSSVYSSVNPTGTPKASYTPTETAPGCPAFDASSQWMVSPSTALPTISGLDIRTVTARTTRTSSGASATSTASPEPATGGSSGGLSRGAIAGIVIGSVVVIGAAISGAFICLRKRQGKEQATVDEGEPQYEGARDDLKKDIALAALPPTGRIDKAELPANSVGPHVLRQEMDATSKNLQATIQDPAKDADSVMSSSGTHVGSQTFEMEGSAPQPTQPWELSSSPSVSKPKNGFE